MKKAFLSLAFVIISSFAFANEVELNENEFDFNNPIEMIVIEESSETTANWGCFAYAIAASYAEMQHYGGTMEGQAEAATWYYHACLEADGNILMPIFL